MNNKTIIIYDSIPYFVPYIEKTGVNVFPTYTILDELPAIKKNLLKIARRFSVKTGWFLSYWYADWKHFAKGAERVIVFATIKIDHIQYLKQLNPNIKVILWYWDPVFVCYDPTKIPPHLCDFWSFDKNDCRTYHLKHNTTFYFKDIKISNEKEKLYDLLFVGMDKGRREKLQMIEERFRDLQINAKFYITSNIDDVTRPQVKPIPYNEYLEMIQQSKALLDYVQEGQFGMTLRIMESLFFQKKLVTNDIMIKHEEFYKPENIFILGVDDMSGLYNFINSPYKPLPTEMVKSYDFRNWLSRFDLI